MLVFPDIDPVAFQIGPVAARWYGMAYAAGFLFAWWWGRRRAARDSWRGFSARDVDDLITWLLVGLVLGGRLGFALFYEPAHYLSHPLDIVKIWEGGMSFHGGAVGVAVVVWLFGRARNMAFWQVGDFLVPLVPPGLFFGRLGNFVNGELWGRASDVPWAMVFPDPASGGVPRHPSQLYEAGLEGLALFVILWLYSRAPRPWGRVSGMFLACYGLFRFMVEFARQPDAQLGFIAFGWLTMGQLLCVPMVLIGLWLIARSRSSSTAD